MAGQAMNFVKLDVKLSWCVLTRNPNVFMGISRQRRCNLSTEVENEEEKGIIDQKRDISRLPKYLHDRMQHVMNPPSESEENLLIMNRNHLIKRQRKSFARYGKASGVDPGVMWPSKEELSEKIEDEKIFEPSLQKLWENLENEKRKQEQAIRKREETIQANLAKMPSILHSYKKKLVKRGEAIKADQTKQQRLLADAKDIFGYDIDLKDPRFTQLKEEKAEQEKQAKKQKARDEKSKAYAAKMQNMSATAIKKGPVKETKSDLSEE